MLIDSILKSRGIILLTKVHIVITMVFPAVTYRCESWTTKKAEYWRTSAFKLWCLRRLESPLDCKEIKPVNPKGNQLWIFIGGTDAEAETPILWSLDVKTHWKITNELLEMDSLENNLILGKIEGKRRRAWQRMWWLCSITDSTDMSLSKVWEMVKDRNTWRAAVHGAAKSRTRLSKWTTTT